MKPAIRFDCLINSQQYPSLMQIRCSMVDRTKAESRIGAAARFAAVISASAHESAYCQSNETLRSKGLRLRENQQLKVNARNDRLRAAGVYHPHSRITP
jgi:hypothetical protein